MNISNENNRRIARNTLLLYIRMFISMAITLYTSRVVMQMLGVEDYGIYGVVGGVVAIFNFLTVSMASSTSRFLAFELGKGDKSKMQETFVSAFWGHVFIAILVALLVESIGVWFLNNKMDIPLERLFASNVVLQMAIFSMISSVIKVPFTASVISYEHMDTYAYIELIDVGLRLIIAFMLIWGNCDKLILYSILTFSVMFLMLIIYVIYCRLHYSECKVRFRLYPHILKSMIKFSGWDLYGNMSVAMRTQGVNIILNLFFGPVVNAAAGIATQVQGAVMSFGSSITTAVKPQIIKYYAQGEYDKMTTLIRNSIKFNYIILLLPTIPLAAELNFVLFKWLGVVPDWTVSFCILTLLFNLQTSIAGILVTGIHATGKNFLPSVINGTLYLLVIPFSYIAYYLGADPWIAFAFNLLAVIMGMLSNTIVLHNYIPNFSIRAFIIKDMPNFLLVMLLSSFVCLLCKQMMEEGWIRLFVSIILSSIMIIVYSCHFIIPKTITKQVVKSIKVKYGK